MADKTILTQIKTLSYRIACLRKDFLAAVGVGPTVNLANTVFVDPNGNDTAAIKGDIKRPWLTFDAAHLPMLSGDTMEMFTGDYTVDINAQIKSENKTFELGESQLTSSVVGDAFTITGNSKFKINAKVLTLNQDDVSATFINAASYIAGSSIDVTSDEVNAVALGVTTWGRTILIAASVDDLNVDLKKVRYWGQGLIDVKSTRSNITIGHVTIVDNGGVDGGRFDEGIVTLRNSAVGGGIIGQHIVNIGTFVNERADEEKGSCVTISGDTMNAVVNIGNYISSADRTGIKAAAYNSVFSFYEYAMSFPAATGDNIHLSYNIDNVVGEHLYSARRGGTNLTEIYTIKQAIVDVPLYVKNLVGAGTNLSTNFNSYLNFDHVQVTNRPVVLIKSDNMSNSSCYIKGGTWVVTTDYGIYINQYEMAAGSTLVIDIGTLQSADQAIYLSNFTVGAGCKVVIKGRYESTVANSSVIHIQGGTWTGDLILDDCTLINDGGGAAVSSSIAINVVVHSSQTNSLIVDANVTELVDALTKDVNVK